MDQLLRSALAQRLADHLRSQVEPLGGILHARDPGQTAADHLGTGLRLGTALPKALLDALGLAREGIDYGSKVGTGALLAANAEANPFLKLFPDSPGAHIAQQALAGFQGAGTQNPIGRFREANEAGAAGNEIAVGLLNQATNPLSYVTGGGTPAAQAAARAQRAASGLNLDLNLVNQLLYPEAGALGALGSKVVEKVGAPLTQRALTAILRDRYTPTGDVGPKQFAEYAGHMGLPVPEKVPTEPSDLVPGTANVRQLLRGLQARTKAAAQTDLLAPIEQAALPEVPARAPLDLMRELLQTGDSGRDLLYPPRDPQFWQRRTGVDPALVPDLLRQLTDEGSLANDRYGELINTLRTGGERTAVPTPEVPTPATGPLTSDELDQLVNFAYPDRAAQANAILKYPNPDDLTEAALNRVGQNPDTLATFARRHPGLAERLVDLPDPRLGTDEELPPAGFTGHLGITPGIIEGPRRIGGSKPIVNAPAEGEAVVVKTFAGEAPKTSFDFARNLAERTGRPYYLRTRAEFDRGLRNSPDPYRYFTEVVQGEASDRTFYKADEPMPFWQFGGANPGKIEEIARPPIERRSDESIIADIEDLKARGQVFTGEDVRRFKIDEGAARGIRAVPKGDNLGITPGLAGIKGAGNWLMRPLVNGAPGVNRLGIAGSGALAGAATGGLMPADTEEDRRQNALTGAAAGGALALGSSTVAARPVIQRLTNTAGQLVKEANTAQLESMARQSKGLKVLGDIPGIWSVQTTENLRNLLQSPATAALWLKNSGARLGEFGKNYLSMVDLYNLGVKDPYDVQPAQTTAVLDALGKTGYIPKLGRSFQSVNGDLIQKLSAMDTALVEAGLAAANPLYGGIPGAGLALGFGKGYTRAWQHSIYGTLDDFAELSARHTSWQDEILPLLKVASTDFLDRHGLTGALSPDGLFSPQEVGQLAGQAAGDEWRALSDRVVSLAEDRARDVLGDFAARGKLETIAGKGIPFIGWAVRAYPRTAKMMLDHPGVSLALTMLMFNAAETDKREGVPGYQVGNLAIGQDTPILGGIAKALTGGQPGEMRVNLLSGLSPVGGSVLAEDDLPEDANLYQQAKAAVGRLGYAPSPIIQALAYGLNKDYTKPGALSRTAGLETVLPGPQVPSLAAGPLNKLREAAGGSAQTSTPHDRKLAEVYFRLTGFPISDPSNMQNPERRALLLDTLNPDSEIRKQADREMAISGTAKSLLSLGSPVTATPRTDLQAQAQQTRQDMQALPAAKYTPQQIAAMEKSRGLNSQIEAYLMQKANRGTQGDIPDILQITRGASGGERGQDILSGLTEGSLFGGGNYYQQYLLQNLLGIQPTR